MQCRRIVSAAAIVTAAGAVVAFTLPSMAGTTPPGRGPTPKAVTLVADGLVPQVLKAIQRDVGVDGGQARARLKKQEWASGATAGLRVKTGASYAGAWLSKDGTTLNVAVTDDAAADVVTRAGAKPKRVKYSEQELDSAKRSLDRVSTGDTRLPGWYVDVTTNKVVVRAHPGEARRAQALIAAAGLAADSVKIVTTDAKPKLLADVRGADPYLIKVGENTGRCSIGFAVEGGFVTAGHCGTPGTETLDIEEKALGVVKASVFPGDADMGFVEVNADSVVQALVNDFEGNDLPVAGSLEAPIGALVCRSGSTTGLFCGRIIAKNQTVNYPEGAVTGLTQTNVCAEGGDSGGSWLSGAQAQGVTSGGSGDCTRLRRTAETFFQPLKEILEANNLTLITTEEGGQGEQGEQGEGGGKDGEGEEGESEECTVGEILKGSLDQVGSTQIQPEGGEFTAAAGAQSACLDAPEGAAFDLFLQRLEGEDFATVAEATGEGDKKLTFEGTEGTYRYVVSAKSGTGDYTLGINVP